MCVSVCVCVFVCVCVCVCVSVCVIIYVYITDNKLYQLSEIILSTSASEINFISIVL